MHCPIEQEIDRYLAQKERLNRVYEAATVDATTSVRENVDELIEAIACGVYLRMVLIAARMNTDNALVLGQAVQGIVQAAENEAIENLVEMKISAKSE